MEAKVHEHQDVRQPRNALDETPGPNVRAGTPIRRFEYLSMASGEGALNRAASYTALLSLPFLGITPDVNCRIGAETSNVQDEPRPWLARAVLLGARIVTAMVVGSGALLGRLAKDFSKCVNRRFPQNRRIGLILLTNDVRKTPWVDSDFLKMRIHDMKLGQ